MEQVRARRRGRTAGRGLHNPGAGLGVRSPFPFDAKLDLQGKRPIYAREDVAYLWFVDPAARTLEAFALQGGEWSPAGVAREAEPVRLPPFEAVAFPLDALWP